MELKNLQHSSLIIALSKGTIFAKKYADFLQKMLTSTRLARSWYLKVYFLELQAGIDNFGVRDVLGQKNTKKHKSGVILFT